jgi:hypothetical protein
MIPNSRRIKSVHFDPNYHFALYYKPELATSVHDPGRGLGDAHGFSGSRVWNTRRIERLQGNREWSPDDALLTGLVWGWPTSDRCLLATKIEHIRVFLDSLKWR